MHAATVRMLMGRGLDIQDCTYAETFDLLSERGAVISLTPAARGWKAVVSEAHNDYSLMRAIIERETWEDAAEYAIHEALLLI